MNICLTVSFCWFQLIKFECSVIVTWMPFSTVYLHSLSSPFICLQCLKYNINKRPLVFLVTIYLFDQFENSYYQLLTLKCTCITLYLIDRKMKEINKVLDYVSVLKKSKFRMVIYLLELYILIVYIHVQ